MTSLDFPEARILERTLKELGLDAATALAVLLKTLCVDHARGELCRTAARAPHLEPVDDLADDYDPDDEANARTTLERLHLVLKREAAKNGSFAARHDPSGTTPDASLPAAARVAGELMMVQDDLREIVARFTDGMDVYESALHARAAPPDRTENAGAAG